MAPSLQIGASQTQAQTQTQILAPQQRQSLEMLAMCLPDLRAQLYREMAKNPVIEDIEQTIEKQSVSDGERASERREKEREGDYIDDENAPAEAYTADEDAVDRRQRFFDSQTKEETLEEHLVNQLAYSGIEPEDRALAEILIGDLNDDGLFAGSIPDIRMVAGVSEEKVMEVLAKIKDLDPPGCGALTHQECLLAQLDKLEDSPYREEVRQLLERHWDDMAKGNIAAIERDLGCSHERYADLLRALRTLEPRPGRAYSRSGHGIAYVNPEVHVVKTAEGRWEARVDDRSLPDIRVSPKYVKMLEDPKTDPETKAYIRERIAALNAIVEAVEHRQETITAIAQAIFDAQPGFFTDGLKGLKPLTMQEIADKVGVHHTTVSRTVRDKYASTPKGTVELRQFFTQGFATKSGEVVSKDAVAERIKALVDGEDKAHPLSDQKIVNTLVGEGFDIARRTVAKYRTSLGIPGTSERRARG